jgi:hypothetical protein
MCGIISCGKNFSNPWKMKDIEGLGSGFADKVSYGKHESTETYAYF